jgi:hypothetical protein
MLLKGRIDGGHERRGGGGWRHAVASRGEEPEVGSDADRWVRPVSGREERGGGAGPAARRNGPRERALGRGAREK